MQKKDCGSDMISTIFHTRINLIKQLKYRGFNVSDYDEFSISDINNMMFNDKVKVQQLDLLLNNDDTQKKIYVKYYLAKKVNKENIQDMVEDIFKVEQILDKKDDLLIITKDPPNDTITTLVKNIWETQQIYISIRHLAALTFNILEHTLVPKHTIVSDDNTKIIMNKYNINNISLFPEISRFDPVALTIGLRPNMLCEIIRPSKTSVTTKYYRVCI